jgi:hypothetical protein
LQRQRKRAEPISAPPDNDGAEKSAKELDGKYRDALRERFEAPR